MMKKKNVQNSRKVLKEEKSIVKESKQSNEYLGMGNVNMDLTIHYTQGLKEYMIIQFSYSQE